MASRDSVKGLGALYPLDDFVWTVRTHPKTGKPYLCVSTPGNAPAGATLYVAKPSPLPSSSSHSASASAVYPSRSPTSPKLNASTAVSPKLTPLSSPPLPSGSASARSSLPTSSLSSSSRANNVKTPAKPPPKEEPDELPPPEDDDDEDILYCEVCEDDERHPASHRCMVCELDVCRKKHTAHMTPPSHRLVTLAEIKEQEIVRYRALFTSPGFSLTKKYVEVLFNDPGALEDGEMPLTKGEFIEVELEKSETPEWWHGSKVADRSMSGLFPNNYVVTLNLAKLKALVQPSVAPPSSSSSMRAPKPPPKTSSASSSASPSPSSASASMIVSKSPKASSAATNKADAEAETKSEKCNLAVIAIHEFKQTTGTYLSFVKGERLTIIRKKSEKWWWGINSKGSKGWVPANHVQLV